jgi:hydroxypyruvate reductase
MSQQETILKNAFSAAVAVADPQLIVPQYLDKIFPVGNEPRGRCVVVGAGKASASMASALELIQNPIGLRPILMVWF